MQRLLKEESTYRAELASQESRLRKLEQETSDDDGNREWSVRQEVRFILSLKISMSVIRVEIGISLFDVLLLRRVWTMGHGRGLNSCSMGFARGLVRRRGAGSCEANP